MLLILLICLILPIIKKVRLANTIFNYHLSAEFFRLYVCVRPYTCVRTCTCVRMCTCVRLCTCARPPCLSLSHFETTFLPYFFSVLLCIILIHCIILKHSFGGYFSTNSAKSRFSIVAWLIYSLEYFSSISQFLLPTL